MKGKENVRQQRQPGINLRGFSIRISSTTDISSLFENILEFILGRTDGRLRFDRRNLLVVARQPWRRHDRRWRRASSSRISSLVLFFAPSACQRNQLEGIHIRSVEKRRLISTVEIFEIVTYSSRYSSSIIVSNRCRHLSRRWHQFEIQICFADCYDRYRSARFSSVSKIVSYFQYSVMSVITDIAKFIDQTDDI